MDVEAENDFREYVASRYRSLLGTAYLLCGNHGRAEDLVQNTLAKAYLAWDRVRRESADRYVRRVMLNDHLSQRRRLWWREVPTEQIEVAGDADIHRIHERDVLFRALRTLPARQRAAVVLRHYEDLSEAQAAEVLGCSVGTVKSLTARGLDRLRTALAAEAPAAESSRRKEAAR